MEEKRCSKCKEVKLITEFWASGYRNNIKIYKSKCKYCIKPSPPKNKICKLCSKEFKPYTTLDKFCSSECRINFQKSKRSSNWKNTDHITGKNNPAYRNGNYCRSTKKNATGQRLFNKNKIQIQQNMLDELGFIYCENCGTSKSLRFESHHLIFRSEKPLHKNLHNKKNILIVCIKCHNEFHKHKGLRNRIVKQRELHLLFGKDVLNK